MGGQGGGQLSNPGFSRSVHQLEGADCAPPPLPPPNTHYCLPTQILVAFYAPASFLLQTSSSHEFYLIDILRQVRDIPGMSYLPYGKNDLQWTWTWLLGPLCIGLNKNCYMISIKKKLTEYWNIRIGTTIGLRAALKFFLLHQNSSLPLEKKSWL